MREGKDLVCFTRGEALNGRIGVASAPGAFPKTDTADFLYLDVVSSPPRPLSLSRFNLLDSCRNKLDIMEFRTSADPTSSALFPAEVTHLIFPGLRSLFAGR